MINIFSASSLPPQKPLHLRLSACAAIGKIRKPERREVILLAKKENRGCGCVPPGKAEKSKPLKKKRAKKQRK